MTLAGTFEFLAICSGVRLMSTDRDSQTLSNSRGKDGLGRLKPNPLKFYHLLLNNNE